MQLRCNTGAVTIKKLSTTNGFVWFDFDDAPSVGLVRSAPKILQGGAEWLARSITYSFASFGIQQGGASAGINAVPDDRAASIAAFVEEVTPMVTDGSFRPNAGKGLPTDAFAGLAAADGRAPLLWEQRGPVSGADELTAAGIVTGIERALGGLEGKTVAIEGFGPVGIAVAQRLESSNATVVAVGTPKGAAMSADGFSAGSLAEAWSSHGDSLVEQLGVDAQQHLKIFGAACDAICVGSKAGALTHQGAAYVKASAFVGSGPAPLTTKALIVLRNAGVTVIPAFLTVAGPLLVGANPSTDGDLAEHGDAVAAQIGDAIDDAGRHPEGHFLGACTRAETFIDGWRDQRPFGRPLG